MNLSYEDKATLIAAAKILMRDPEEWFIGGCGDCDGDTQKDVAERIYEVLGWDLYGYCEIKPSKYEFEKIQRERNPPPKTVPKPIVTAILGSPPMWLINPDGTRTAVGIRDHWETKLLHPEWSVKIQS